MKYFYFLTIFIFILSIINCEKGVDITDPDTTTTDTTTNTTTNTTITTTTTNYEAGKGSYVYTEINGSFSKVYTKYFTGNLGTTTPLLIAHGVSTALNILNVETTLYLISQSAWGTEVNNPAGVHCLVRYDNSNLKLYFNSGAGASRNQDYKIKIDYYE